MATSPVTPVHPGQPQLFLVLVAVALAQERKAQGWPNQTIKDTREAETTQAQPGPSHQVAQIDLTEKWTAQGPGPQSSASVSLNSGAPNGGQRNCSAVPITK
jgi:hypothetical protein